MLPYKNDSDLFTQARTELYTAVIGDICDQMGLRHQFLAPQIRPLQQGPGVPLLIGRAMTVLEADVFDDQSASRVSDYESTTPFGRMLEALDDLKQDEVYICAGASPRYALVGEIMATAMKTRGAVGAVCEGYIRDSEGILDLEFPVYSFGPYAQDQRGRGKVIDFRVPIEVSGIPVHPGDIVVADIDGALVVPRDHEIEIFERAFEKARTESTVRQAILEGMGAAEAFRTYGVL